MQSRTVPSTPNDEIISNLSNRAASAALPSEFESPVRPLYSHTSRGSSSLLQSLCSPTKSHVSLMEYWF